LVNDFRVMGNQENLSVAFFDRIRQRHKPRLNFAKRDEVLRLIGNHGATLGHDEVKNRVQSDQTPLAVGQLIKVEPGRLATVGKLRPQQTNVLSKGLQLQEVEALDAFAQTLTQGSRWLGNRLYQVSIPGLCRVPLLLRERPWRRG